jgi:CheY-like chemotaxis protein
MFDPLTGTPAQDKARKKILIIEDNNETQLILKIYLRDHYEIDSVPSAMEGLKKIEQNYYNLIVLDINLPGELDGNDVIRKLKKNPEYKSIPILVITAYALKGDKEKYLSMGADGYLSKPVGKKEVLRLTGDLTK